MLSKWCTAEEQFASSIADYFPTSYTFDLQANNVKTGEVVARVRCEADRRGIIACRRCRCSTSRRHRRA